MFAIFFRFFLFLLIAVGAIWGVIELFLRYGLPMFVAGLRKENKIYEKWRKFWRT